MVALLCWTGLQPAHLVLLLVVTLDLAAAAAAAAADQQIWHCHYCCQWLLGCQ
jgi:hypothetical protein